MTLASLGPSFDLGTLSSSSNGEAVDIATLANGQIVAVWDEALVPPGSGITDDEGIFARLYTDSGAPASAAFQVHGDVDLSEYRPAVTALAGGGFVITWHHNADYDFATGFFDVDIWAQVFDASGNKVGDAIEIVADEPIGNSTADDQTWARPVALADGGFIVTWEQGDSESAMGQRYNASGAPVGSAVELFDNIGQAPNAVQLANGDVAVVNSHNYALELRLSGANLTGAPTGASGATGPLVIQSPAQSGTMNVSSTPSVAAHPDGGAIVVSVTKIGYFDTGIQVDRIGADGTILTSVQIIRNVPYSGSLMAPQIAVRPDGSFAVVWEDKIPFNAPDQSVAIDIAMAEFGTDGAMIGDVYIVNDVRAGNQQDPTITVTDDGNYFVAYIDSASSGSTDEVRGIVVTTGGSGGTDPDPVDPDPADPDPVTPVIDGKTLTGTKGANRLVGGARNDEIKGGKGNDKLFGKAGDDVLKGDAGNDMLNGGAGNDVLDGGSGRDLLKGGGGNDRLTGGAQADRFVFTKGMGQDIITDFQDNVDTLVLDNAIWQGTANKSQVLSQFASIDGDDVIFDFGNGNTLRIEGLFDPMALLDDLKII